MLASDAAHSSPAPERIKLGALASNVHAYVGRPMEVCGIITQQSSAHPNERFLWEGHGSVFSFYVDGSIVPLPEQGKYGCIVGVARRRDGLTAAEARSRGMYDSYSPDGLQNPEYVLFPLPKQTSRSRSSKPKSVEQTDSLRN